ncbi:HNH endonuclease [Haemophilus influenzae]|uniref:HNH nuclease domain-containing protein n=2 Tax=Haemophilus influenzae TaxID=727 RepID=A0A0D0IJ91_HAEIF|nr:HNH endonuclease [Haemophilus influenzae]EDK08918.1 hypothetical protein CGSHiHH_06807 [Haemophilus influenzae PittHH]KIP50135.1 hypothetical protein SU59_00545 [Haemophilus influenzae]KIS35693.1 hypothetical protein NTHI1209_01301 [Haemophilus influenzae]KMZ30789.1 hypothetical protein ABN30_07770 [Haemophilus influenzae]MCK8858368.1 HNH endonuclease [Haemophilus influenzae]
MMNNYTPKKPFDCYKWYFATKAPTEALGDPAVLLGLISRIAPLANKGNISYSSNDFKLVMENMHKDTVTTINLSERVGDRNLMRNSAQYWKLFGLIPQNSRGEIKITPFAQDIVNGKISQIDFAATMIVSLTLPNKVSYSNEEILSWRDNNLSIHPFKLILQILRELFLVSAFDAWITNEELYSIVIPMAGDHKKPKEIIKFILQYRNDKSIIDGWYNAVPRSNDKRFSSEFLRFLANFGFIEKEFELISSSTRNTTKFKYIPELDEQISVLINGSWTTERSDILQSVRQLDIENLVRQSANTRASARPKQQQFRKSLIENLERCVITGNMLTRVLQAAHIKPYAYGGSDDISNGLLLRADIHIMFDAGLINLRPDPFYKNRCFIELSDDDLVRRSYPSFVNEITIQLPKFTNMENIEWRYENRLLGVNT